jgi:hypothetical protein
LNGYIADVKISSDYRGKRYVFNRKILYNKILDKYVTEYKADDKTVYEFTESEYISPNIIQNLVTGSSFTSTVGWTGQYITTYNGGFIREPKQVKTYGPVVTATTTPTNIIDDILSGNTNNKTYTPCLKVEFPSSTTY